MAENGETKVFLDALELYNADISLAKSPVERKIAGDKLLKALRSQKVSDKLIEKTATMIGAFADNEIAGVTILQEALKRKVSTVQDLEKTQADKLMNLMAQPEQAKAGIASIATTIATICRFFGADDFADSIETKAKEIMSTVHVPLNKSGITDERATIEEAIDHAGSVLSKSNALKQSSDFAKNNKDIVKLPNAAEEFIDGPQAKTPATKTDQNWRAYREAMIKAGVKEEKLNALLPAWTEAAKDGKLNTPAETVEFLASKAVRSLDETDRKTVAGVTRELTPMGSQTVSK